MKKLTFSLLLILCTALISSCSKDVIEPENGNPQEKVYTLNLNATHVEFDNTATKAGEYTWPDGAKLYIMFSDKDKKNEYAGTATYSKATGKWTIPAPQGNLHKGDSTACKVVYIDKKPEGDIITLTTDDIVYEDVNAKYLLGSETLTIRTTLSPKTSRVRFKGTPNSVIKVFGTEFYNKYNISYNTFGKTDKEMELTVKQDGYTPYVHVYFPNTAKKLEITDSNDKIYIYKCPDDFLAPGASHFFNIPTPTKLQGWRAYDRTRTYKVKDVEFKMIYVQHIDQSFYLAETETTQKLWCAAGKRNLSFHQAETLDLPVENITRPEINSFIATLNTELGTAFTCPSYNQWFYAARGGVKSLGYKYAGSDTLDDIAWILINANGSTQSVKTKKPNELGLYDMLGNVCENTSGTIDAYGGDYGSPSPDNNELLLSNGSVPRTNYINDTRSERFVGFRLCINL